MDISHATVISRIIIIIYEIQSWMVSEWSVNKIIIAVELPTNQISMIMIPDIINTKNSETTHHLKCVFSTIFPSLEQLFAPRIKAQNMKMSKSDEGSIDTLGIRETPSGRHSEGPRQRG